MTDREITYSHARANLAELLDSKKSNQSGDDSYQRNKNDPKLTIGAIHELPLPLI
jgi:hypothetical protein